MKSKENRPGYGKRSAPALICAVIECSCDQLRSKNQTNLLDSFYYDPGRHAIWLPPENLFAIASGAKPTGYSSREAFVMRETGD